LKITREIKTAILVIASILLFIWGYSFLKGRDLFVDYKTYYVKYDNVLGLPNSAPVSINGLVVGKVSSIKLNKDWTSTVELQIKGDFQLTKGSVAEIFAPSPIGGKEISIIPNSKDTTIAEDKTFLVASNKLGLTDEVAKQIEPLKEKINKLLDNANVMLENVNAILDAKTKENLKSSIANLDATLAEFKAISKNTNDMIAENKSKLNSTMTNVDKASANFAKSVSVVSKSSIGISRMSMISHSSIPSDIFMIVTPVIVSPFMRQDCIGEAPRYFGNIEPCTFMQCFFGISRSAFGMIRP